MNLDDLKLHLDRLFAARPGSTREEASMLRAALVEFKVGIGQLREGLTRSERELEAARRDVSDYERRGSMAAAIGDDETRTIAEEFTLKAKERLELLERKILVQRDEVFMAERDYEATKTRFKSASRGIPVEEAPAADPLINPERMSTFEQVELDQRAREAAVDAQLAMLKKKLGER